MKLIDSGAEAKIYLNKDIIKDRIEKDYRIKEIDIPLRKFRTRREAKILEKLQQINFPSPKLISVDDKKMKLKMEFIKGPKLKEVLEKKDFCKLCSEVGKKLAILHNHGIIHGDLTTSNMIFAKEISFIDFGLGFFSEQIEDKAVELHLFKQALESKHYKIWKKCFKSFLQGYKHSKDFNLVLSRFEKVELRGRNKSK